jgi:hypothetical protein
MHLSNSKMQPISSPKSITHNSPMAGFKLDIRSKGRNNNEILLDRERFLGSEILSERLKTNNLNTKNDSGIGIFSGFSNQNFKDGKKLNSTISGFLSKRKSNPGSISIKHTKSFFGQSGVSENLNTINTQHTVLGISSTNKNPDEICN